MDAVSEILDETGLTRAKRVRFIGRISGRYMLPNRAGAAQRTVFACRTQAVSVLEVVVAAPVNGEIGTPIKANFDDIGLVNGTISRQFQDGFAFAVSDGCVNMNALQERISWLKKQRAEGTIDLRSCRRVIPRVAQTILILPNNGYSRGFIMDMSASGAAISTEFQPSIGTSLSVGSVIGRVVRHIENGFALKFLQTQDITQLEGRMTSFNEEWASKFHSLAHGRSLKESGLSGLGELDPTEMVAI